MAWAAGEDVTSGRGPGDARRLLGDRGVDTVLSAGLRCACNGVVAVFAAAGAAGASVVCGRGDGGGSKVDSEVGGWAATGPDPPVRSSSSLRSERNVTGDFMEAPRGLDVVAEAEAVVIVEDLLR